MSKGKLYLIPTVISGGTQSNTITEQVRNTVQNVQHFLVENLRTARRYISSLNLGIDIDGLHLEVLDKNTNHEELLRLMTPILEGKDIGIISESGCPGIADPGSQAVGFAHGNSIQVVPLVGPSSILMALMASGFNGQSFVFHGYIPIDKEERKRRIRKMEGDAHKLNQTQMFMDTPYRNKSLMNDLLKNCNPNSRICVARDITGAKELIQTKTVMEWKSMSIPDLHKIPVIFALYH